MRRDGEKESPEEGAAGALARIQEIGSLAELEALSAHWSDLWDRCPRATPFQSPEWLLPWWKRLGRGSLWALALWTGPRLVGLAPFFVTAPFRRLRWLGTGNTDYLGLLAEEGREAGLAGLVAERLVSQKRRWAFADLQQLPPGSRIADADWGPFFRVRRTVQEVCPALELPPTVEEWGAALSSKLRSNLGYYRRRLEREGDARFVTADETNLTPLLDRLFELHGARWRKRKLPGVFSRPAVQRFHREAAAGFLKRGWLRLHGLVYRDQVAAVLYCFQARERVFYYAGGFDPALSRLSPGTVLTGHAMEESIRAGAREWDFLRGDEPYKYAWGARNRTNQRLLVTPVTPNPGRALVDAEERIERLVKRWVRRWLH
jgi:CelD/BcsL family acetyltransferase involved in cellulose biosynthesis